MAIPEAQLVTWSAQGSVTQSSATYAAIKNVLEDAKSPYAARSFSTFLQGSYGNDTNVYADSDVDIVICLDSTFYYNLDDLIESEKEAFKRAYNDATYGLLDFKKEVIAWLTAKFGSDVKVGTKAIFIKGNGGRRDADVLVAAKHRRFSDFPNIAGQRHAEGIVFYESDRTQIINYPKQHSANCTSRHQATNGWFKPTIRVFKNLRNRLKADGLLADGLAPSYFLEGLLYNVPPGLFGTSYTDTFTKSFKSIVDADRSQFVCVNERHWLFRDGSAVCWPPGNCLKFLNAAGDLWNNW